MTEHQGRTSCAACAAADGRRDFLKHAAALVAGALAGVAGGGARASALALTLGQALDRTGSQQAQWDAAALTL